MSEREALLRIVLVDDEEPARLGLRQELEAIGGVEIVGECANGFEAVKLVGDAAPDAVFLDVQMPKLDGFEVLELIGSSIPVVFVTAYDEYALRAFEVHAVDYLLKPASRDRLAEALDRVRERGMRPPSEARALRAAARPPGVPLERVVIRDGTQVHVVAVDRIDYVQAQDDYVAVSAGGRRYLKEQTLSYLERRLDPTRFVRIHRRYVLQLDRLARIETTATSSRVAVLRDQTTLPISRSGYRRLSELLER